MSDDQVPILRSETAKTAAVRAEQEASTRREVGSQIRQRRQERGMSLRTLARELGVSPATVSAMETGKVGVTSVRLSEVSSILQTGPASLLPSLPTQARSPRSRAVSAAPPADIVPNRQWRTFEPLDLDPILRAALRLFVERGFHGATIRQIAQEAGMSVPGVYHYYPSKVDVLAALLDLTMNDLLSRSIAARDEGRNPTQRFAFLVECLALFHTHRRDLGFIGASETRSMVGEHRERFATERRHQQQLVDDEVAAGVASGDFTVESATGAGRAVTMLCTSLCQWYRQSNPLTPEALAAEYVAYALNLVGHRSHSD